MAIELITYNENIRDTGTSTLNTGNEDEYIVNNNDGIVIDDTNLGDQDKTDDILGLDTYTFRVISNIENAEVLVNGELQGVSTPGFIRIKKSDLFANNIKKTITVQKNGYTSNERYEVFITALSEPTLDEVDLYRNDQNEIFNISDIDIRIAYYVNDALVDYDFNSELATLRFDLTRVPVNEDGKKTITSILTGDSESAIFERVRDGQVFPIESQETERVDNQGERYLLKSVDTSIYRIGAIRLTVDGKTETLFAEEGQSLTTDIILNSDVQVEVITQRLVIREKRQPAIRINTKPRIYNKNEPTGVPIRIDKLNELVESVSVVVGEQMFEFDNLGSNSSCIITIPAKAFENLGRYNLKIFPYSIAELEEFTQDNN